MNPHPIDARLESDEEFARRPLTLTPRAAAAIAEMIRTQALNSPWLRVTYEHGAYGMDISEVRPDPAKDLSCNSHGINILVDRRSAVDLIGFEIDFDPTRPAAGFSFRKRTAPNLTRPTPPPLPPPARRAAPPPLPVLPAQPALSAPTTIAPRPSLVLPACILGGFLLIAAIATAVALRIRHAASQRQGFSSAALIAPTRAPAAPAVSTPAPAPGTHPSVAIMAPVPPRPSGERVGVGSPGSAKNEVEKSEMIGDPHSGGAFERLGRTGTPIIGFRITMGTWADQTIVRRLEPIYAGRLVHPGPEVFAARDGYAVDGLTINGDDHITALKIRFTRQQKDNLLAGDSYETDWIGQPTAAATHELSGKGKPVVGIFGRKGLNVDALGLVISK